MEQLRGRKGIMFTLVTIVVVVLLLGEVLTYLYTNTQYSNLGVQSAPSLAATSLYNQVRLNSPSFLQTSLTNAFAALNAYEQSTSSAYRISNASYALGSLMDNGTIYGTNMAGYMGGYTVSSYVASISKQAKSEGMVASMGNENVVVFQNSPGQVGAIFYTLLNVSSAYGTVAYPITVNASVPLSGLPDLFGSSIGGTVAYTANKTITINNLTAPLAKGSIYVGGNAIANAVIANSVSSHSVYLFAAGPIFVDNVIPASCTDAAISSLPSGQPGNYILVTYNAFQITTTLCGFEGLVTYQVNSISAPTKPYLVYNSIITQNVISYLKTGGSYVLDGNTLSLYDPSALQSAVYSRAYLASAFSPTYLSIIGGSQSTFSPYGVAPLSVATRPVASFNSVSNVVATSVQVSKVTGAFTTASFWMQWPSAQNDLVPFSFNSYSIYITGNAIGFGTTSGGSVLGANMINLGPFTMSPWVHVVAEFDNGVPANDVLYVNGARQTLSSIGGTLPSTVYGGSTVSIGGFGSGATYKVFNGMIANLQMYNVALTPYQAYSLYASGINSGPVNYSTLIGWWPLNGNLADYSHYHNNGTSNAPTYGGLSGYYGDSLDGGSFYHLPDGGVQGVPQVYVPVQQNYSTSGTVQQATTALGFVNNTVPNSAYFNGTKSYVTIPNTANLNGWAYQTIAAWVNVPSATEVVDARLIEKGANNEWTIVFNYATGNNKLTLQTIGTSSACVTTAAPIPTGWHNIVAQFTYATGAEAVYVDGQLSASGTCAPTASGRNGNIYLGTYGGTPGTYVYNGSMADVQVYNTILTSNQIGQLYLNNTVPGVGPKGWWPLNNNLNDQSGNGDSGVSNNILYLPLGVG